jgi:hypothetical protein
MSERLARVIDKARGLDADVHDIFFDDGKLLVRLNESALLHLDSIVRKSLESLPESGSPEIGGILIGTTARDHSIVKLLEVIPICSEHRSGPEFRPSEADLQTFADVIKAHSFGPQQVIGYFRSHIGDPVSLRVEDENLLRRFFGGDGCSVILVHADTDPVKQATVWLGQWNGGDNVRLLDRFPLVTAQFTGQVRTKADNASLMPRPVAQSERFRRVSIAAAAAFVLLGIFTLGRLSATRGTTAKPAALPVSLGMTFEAHDAVVEVKWNPASPAVLDSDRGALDFADGAGVSRIELNQSQLRAGHFAYVPRESWVTCVMTVHQNNQVFVGQTQSVHLDLPEPRMAPPVNTLADAENLVENGSPLQSANENTLRVSLTSLKQEPPRQKPQPSAPQAPTVSFRAPSAAPSVPPAPRLEDPPKLPVVESAGVLVPGLPSTAFSIPSTGAKPRDTANRIEKLLGPLAVHAARLWRFSPVRRNGTAVASETGAGFPLRKN